MTDSSEHAALNAGKTKRYRIRVAGNLDPVWSDRIGGLLITGSGRPRAESTTILEGELRDQGALIGVINTLYELHLPLLSIESFCDPQTSEKTKLKP